MKLKCRACCRTMSFSLMVAVSVGAGAAEKSIRLPNDNPMAQLKPGPNVDVVRNNRTICQSTDYIVRQPASDAKKWEGEVQKMSLRCADQRS